MTKKLLIFAFVAVSTISIAQQGTNSPYSFYGLGSLKFKGTVENQSMGGLSVYSDSIHINLRNPASYAGTNLAFYNNESRPVKFSIGTSFSSTTLETTTASDEYGSSSISYLAVALPIKKFGIGFGVLPYTSVGYKLQSLNDEDLLQYRYRGEGGLNRTFFGLGYQLSKNLKIGLDVQYNFGSILNTSVAFGYTDQGLPLQYQSREEKRSELGGFSYNFGIAYKKNIGKSLEMMFAATYSPEANLDSENQSEFATITIDSNETEFVQSSTDVDLAAQNLLNTSLVMPSKTNVGIGIGKPRKWFVGLDYNFLEASNFTNRFVEIDNASFENASSLSVGGFFIPKYDSFSKYWKRIVYRLGLRLEQTGLVVNNESIEEFGISFGVGIPVGRLFSNANIGFEWGQRGTSAANLVNESFYSINISLSLNDRWFEKRKFN